MWKASYRNEQRLCYRSTASYSLLCYRSEGYTANYLHIVWRSVNSMLLSNPSWPSWWRYCRPLVSSLSGVPRHQVFITVSSWCLWVLIEEWAFVQWSAWRGWASSLRGERHWIFIFIIRELLLALILAITLIFNLMTVSGHARNTSVYSQYITWLFLIYAPVLERPVYYAHILAAP